MTFAFFAAGATLATAEVIDSAVCWSTVIETPPTVKVIFVLVVASSYVLLLPLAGATVAFSAALVFFAAAVNSFFMSFSSLVTWAGTESALALMA